MMKVKWLSIGRTGLEWRPIYFEDKFILRYTYWFYWWNWLRPGFRYIGYQQDYYDGPISSFGFWFFNWSWSLPITNHSGVRNWSTKQ